MFSVSQSVSGPGAANRVRRSLIVTSSHRNFQTVSHRLGTITFVPGAQLGRTSRPYEEVTTCDVTQYRPSTHARWARAVDTAVLAMQSRAHLSSRVILAPPVSDVAPSVSSSERSVARYHVAERAASWMRPEHVTQSWDAAASCHPPFRTRRRGTENTTVAQVRTHGSTTPDDDGTVATSSRTPIMAS